MHSMAGHRWMMILFANVLLGTVCYQEVSAGRGPVRVTTSAVESLRDRGTYIICFKEHATEEELQHFTAVLSGSSAKGEKFTAEIIEEMFVIKCLTAKLSGRALSWVTHHKTVLSVKENKYISFGATDASDPVPDVPAYWHLDRLDQESLPLDKTFTVNNLTGENVDVYILDTGIHYEHADFNGRALYPGCDPIDKLYHQNQAGRDCEGHGTHVAGLVGGNGTGVANGVTLFSVRILDCNLKASIASLIQGLVCVVNHCETRNGTRAIINLSIAGLYTTKEINDSLQLALDNDIIITAAAGNDIPAEYFKPINYNSCKVYPAAYPGVINVGATDMQDNALMGEFDNRTIITNMGECVDVFAPGYKILSSDFCPLGHCNNDSEECIAGMMYNNTCRESRTGTSQSTPLVAGAIALLLEKCPNLTNLQVKYFLRYSLSSDKVMLHKASKYANNTLSGQVSALRTVLFTPNHLLYIGRSLENVINCNIFNGYI